MILENLRLENFKNYKDCSFNFNPKLNFIYGNNGNGKTNILESISLLCYTKSFLQNSEADCVKYGEKKFNVLGEFMNSSELKSKIRFSYDNEVPSKKILLNNESIGRMSGYFGRYPLVVLSPKDMKLTSGTPGDRRRNFDLLISQASRLYVDELKNLNRIIKQKNSLLKENASFKKYSAEKLKSMVDIWNSELAETGTKIIMRRIEFVSEFRKYIEAKFKDIVGDAYIPIMAYESELVRESDSVTHEKTIEKTIGKTIEKTILDNFREALDEKFPLEVKRGISLTGPHRDNYVFKMNKGGEVFDVRTFASQGEHKTFIVALKLSEYKYLQDKLENSFAGEPILLLDDVFSELDKTRIGKISGILPQYNQIFITTTDINYLRLLNEHFNKNDASIYNIVDGTASFVN